MRPCVLVKGIFKITGLTVKYHGARTIHGWPMFSTEDCCCMFKIMTESYSQGAITMK